MPIYLHTLGDSTIDNLYWMLKNADLCTAKSRSVEGILREKGHNVVSHAYDGFTTRSVLESDQIGAVLPRGPEYEIYMRQKAANGDEVSPFDELRKKVLGRPNSTHYVAISVGGNDFRVNLYKPWRILQDISQIQSRYAQIVEKVKGLEGRHIQPLLIFQYRTDANHDPYSIYTVFKILGVIAVAVHLVCFALLTAPIWILLGNVSAQIGGLITAAGAIGLYIGRKIAPLSVTKNVLLGKGIGMSMLGGMMESFYQPILTLAKEHRIPILDLANTFDPYDNLYESGIEPNENGGRLIAEGIDHIVNQHDYSGESVIYSKPSGSSEFVGAANQNASDWRVA